ncbi:DegT/DnrJ/EryC1/StrS family aminotransferase [Halobacteriovorax sp. ZH5_bin.2]|uniref:DegT/DnrJ/EryC1/StrS family aminotransferase n=1 Tax=Halobacteriovorax sp. ZH5_bin.2 TaxID=3157727 RepID=UPI0037173ECD
MKIPFLNLDAQYQEIKDEVLPAIESVLESKKFIQGSICEEFAGNFLKVHGGEFGIGCSNGTSAITLALRALGIKQGDEVITVNNTFFATVEAIVEVGATPVLVDCYEDTYGINEEEVENAISEKTKCIIPVHLYGNPCDMPSIMKIANKHNLKVIEDCAQAHLASINGQAVGTFGDAGTFSFYPGKNLGAYGDAGFVITKTKELRDLVEMYLNHGRTEKYEHEFMAGNYRMDGIQAAILDIKLKYIEKWTNRRIEIAKKYDAAFSNLKTIKTNGKCVYHLYTIEVDNRESFMNSLKEKGISTGIHYPITMSNQPAIKTVNSVINKTETSNQISSRLVSLPICPYLKDEEVDYVITNVKELL